MRLALLGIQLLKYGVTAVYGAAAAAGPRGNCLPWAGSLVSVCEIADANGARLRCKLPLERQSLASLGAAAKPGHGGGVGLSGLIHDPGALPATQPLGPAALDFSTVSIICGQGCPDLITQGMQSASFPSLPFSCKK